MYLERIKQNTLHTRRLGTLLFMQYMFCRYLSLEPLASCMQDACVGAPPLSCLPSVGGRRAMRQRWCDAGGVTPRALRTRADKRQKGELAVITKFTSLNTFTACENISLKNYDSFRICILGLFPHREIKSQLIEINGNSYQDPLLGICWGHTLY